MIEVGAKVFAYVQASGIDRTGDTGVANSRAHRRAPRGGGGGRADWCPSMTRRLMAAIKKTRASPDRPARQHAPPPHHTGGNRFFRGADDRASQEVPVKALAPISPVPACCSASSPRFAAEFSEASRVVCRR